MCACTEPVRTGLSAVYVEYGRPKWPITTFNHTEKQTFLVQKNDSNFYFRHPTLVRPARKKLFCLDSVASLPRPCLTIIKNSTKVILDGFETSHGEIPCVMSSKLSSVLGEIRTYLLGNLW